MRRVIFLVLNQERLSNPQLKKYLATDLKNHSFLIIGNHPRNFLPYLLLVPDSKFCSLPIHCYVNFHYEKRYKGSQTWAITEGVILDKEVEIDTNSKSYGGMCRKCKTYNEYAEVDENRLFTCYRCK